MFTFSRIRFAAPVLPVVLFVVVAATPVYAGVDASSDCAETWESLTAWSVEVEKGVDAALLGALNEITPQLRDCYDGASGGSHDGMGADTETWRPLVNLYFAPDAVETMMCLMAAESGGNPNATNPRSGAAGLFQVMPSWAGEFGYEVDDLYDPGVNMWIASQLLDIQGFGAWSPYLRDECQ